MAEELIVATGEEAARRLTSGTPQKWANFVSGVSAPKIVFLGISFGNDENAPPEIANLTFPMNVEFRDCKFFKPWRFVSCGFLKDLQLTACHALASLSFEDCGVSGRATIECSSKEQLRFRGGSYGGGIHLTGEGPIKELFMSSQEFKGPVQVDLKGPFDLRLISAIFRSDLLFLPGVQIEKLVASDCEFHKETSFEEARFLESVRFPNCIFSGSACFAKSQFSNVALFRNARVRNGKFDFATFQSEADFSGGVNGVFHDVSFANAVFQGEALFDDRTFDGHTSFRNSTFFKAPSFFGAKLHDNYELSSARYRDITSEASEGRYRVLKRLVHEKQASSDEVMFFALELRAKGKRSRWGERSLIAAYSGLSDCGRSVVRPLFWAVFFWVVGVVANASLLGEFTDCSVVRLCPFNYERFEALATLTKVQAMPFLGGAKDELILATKFLKLDGVLPLAVQGLGALLLAMVSGMLFLSLLAVRNLFRMKGTS